MTLMAHRDIFAATQQFGRFRSEADMNRIYEYAPLRARELVGWVEPKAKPIT